MHALRGRARCSMTTLSDCMWRSGQFSPAPAACLRLRTTVLLAGRARAACYAIITATMSPYDIVQRMSVVGYMRGVGRTPLDGNNRLQRPSGASISWLDLKIGLTKSVGRAGCAVVPSGGSGDSATRRPNSFALRTYPSTRAQ